MFIPPTPNLFAMSMSEHLGSFALLSSIRASSKAPKSPSIPRQSAKPKKIKLPPDEGTGIEPLPEFDGDKRGSWTEEGDVY